MSYSGLIHTWLTNGSDSVDHRELPTQVYVHGDMTVEKCVSKCQERGFEYAGVEYADECFCSALPPSSSRKTDCDMVRDPSRYFSSLIQSLYLALHRRLYRNLWRRKQNHRLSLQAQADHDLVDFNDDFNDNKFVNLEHAYTDHSGLSHQNSRRL